MRTARRSIPAVRPLALPGPFAIACALALVTACAPVSPADSAAPLAAPTRSVETPGEGPGPGWITWESNRSGAFRIWIRPLEGGAPRQLSPEEPGRDHCCAHLSPDGVRVAYLSLPGGARVYQPATTDGDLHLVATEASEASDGTGDRIIASPARHYGEHRAVIWWSPTELVLLAGDGATRKLDLAAGSTETIARSSPDAAGWLVDPTGRWATGGEVTFADRDPQSGVILRKMLLGGCQAYFTRDGEFGYWNAGAGGPIDVFDLARRTPRTIVRKNDPRLPEGWRYVYFPMISADRSLLAWAASNGDHDHFRSDYEIFLAAIDPESLELVSAPRRISFDPAVDRFPDVWRLAPPRQPRAQLARGESIEPRADRPGAGSLVALAADLPDPVFVWRSTRDANQRSARAPSETLELTGAVWSDRLDRLVLAGGTAATSLERGSEIDAALRANNELTLALLVQPDSIATAAGGPVIELGYSEKDRGFALLQRGAGYEFILRRSNQFGRRGGPAWKIATVEDPGAHHLAVRFSPGRLAAFLDGKHVVSQIAPDDLFHWRNRVLLIGAELGGAERWRGRLSQIVLWNRWLDDARIAAEATRALATIDAGAEVPGIEVEARLVARSRVPTLDEISPYRRALVVEEYLEARAVGGARAARRLRVARWAIVDALTTPAMTLPPGTIRRLELEPYAAQPQLESVVLSDTLDPAPELALWFDTALRID